MVKTIMPFIVIVIIAALLLIVWVLSSRPDTGNLAFSSFTVCTGNAAQADCSKSIPEIKISWHFNAVGKISEQAYSITEIDDNRNFSSPEYSSGEKFNKENFSLVNSDKLIPGQTYYWRIKIGNNLGVWSDWAVGDDPITINEYCPQ